VHRKSEARLEAIIQLPGTVAVERGVPQQSVPIATGNAYVEAKSMTHRVFRGRGIHAAIDVENARLSQLARPGFPLGRFRNRRHDAGAERGLVGDRHAVQVDQLQHDGPAQEAPSVTCFLDAELRARRSRTLRDRDDPGLCGSGWDRDAEASQGSRCSHEHGSAGESWGRSHGSCREASRHAVQGQGTFRFAAGIAADAQMTGDVPASRARVSVAL
jgi:hypothetical protein